MKQQSLAQACNMWLRKPDGSIGKKRIALTVFGLSLLIFGFLSAIALLNLQSFDIAGFPIPIGILSEANALTLFFSITLSALALTGFMYTNIKVGEIEEALVHSETGKTILDIAIETKDGIERIDKKTNKLVSQLKGVKGKLKFQQELLTPTEIKARLRK